ncbi:PrsW family intramembrane metalloprotease [Halorussus gelatinilyticus]|uniref:PrsW family intramembrane metalloprotease n=1 Tax=Halorussus gelatinilyticus TaxID=2937524 RepID=A0A8U0ID30_9EURY|nr:PrsW family intramembrane metalloprotease [Halorussus gelatinilyticus]UPV98807.1 PrsW family intramembrane metalloprotease [Halorussus gelatinilyticus]
MDDARDPVEEGAIESADLYDVATWESRSWLDRLSAGVYGGVRRLGRVVVVVLALAILGVQFALTGLAAVSDPVIGAFVLLSVVPAFGLAAYIWYADVTTSEPLTLLVGTFLLGVLFAGFAAIINTLAGAITLVPVVGMVLFFYLVVAPVEETVKWLAIRLYAFRSDRFDAVIDGAVYGAMAGLGFATIENAIYITQSISDVTTIGSQQIASAGQTAAVRLLAGPGHVIYSAFAGYYLGLAKFNRENAGPIVVKGLLIAAFIHATYNSLVTYLSDILAFTGVAVAPGIAFLGFVVVYDGVFGYLLYRKISRYRNAYRQTNMGQSVSFEEDERGDVVGRDRADFEESADGSGDYENSEAFTATERADTRQADGRSAGADRTEGDDADSRPSESDSR